MNLKMIIIMIIIGAYQATTLIKGFEMITKNVELNDVVFVVSIREIDLNSFSSQQIAVAKAFAQATGKCANKMIETMAWNKHGSDLDEMKCIWGRAFR